MPKIERNGDANVAGGIAQQGAQTVFANGKNVMLPGMPVTPHRKGGKHKVARTKGGSSTVFAEGLPVIHVNDFDTCGHKRSAGSDDVFVGA